MYVIVNKMATLYPRSIAHYMPLHSLIYLNDRVSENKTLCAGGSQMTGQCITMALNPKINRTTWTFLKFDRATWTLTTATWGPKK